MAKDYSQYRSWIRTTPLLGVALSCCLALGCFGGAHNPGYFPYYLPGGDIIQTHAKPPGMGYYKNFDPKSVRVEVTPDQKTIRPKNQQLIIATVYDKDGVARRGRRVEWIIDGPGSIVEVDESGWAPARGYKVDNKYAVSSTSYREHKLTRGNGDATCEFTIGPGQTWCVISSPVAGETTVTAYAPEIFNSDKSRAYARLNWSDNEFTFPPPISARYGGEASLNTTINRLAEQAGLHPDDVKVRYRVLSGGAPAVLVSSNSGGSTSARGGTGEVDVLTDVEGKAGVRVMQTKPVAGKTQIAVEILKPAPNGVGPGTVVGRSTTAVDWTAPQLSVEVQGPKVIPQDRESTISIVASNPGSVDTSAVNVQARIPEGLELVGADPPPTTRYGSNVTWSIGAISSTRKQEMRVVVRPTRKGSFTITADANTDDGLTAQGRGTVEVGTAALQLKVDPPMLASMGERVPVKFTVTNPSSVPLENATAFVFFESGLEHDTGKEQIEMSVGVINPGMSKTLDVPLIARQAGKFKVRVTVTAGAGTSLREMGETTVEVKRTEMTVVIAGPEKLTPGEEATFDIRVTNGGDMPLPNVTLKAILPSVLTAKQTSEGGTSTSPDLATWTIGTLAPGERKVVRLTAQATKQSEPVRITATAVSTKEAPPQSTGANLPEPKGLTAKAERLVAIVGQPALVLELADPREPVPVGRKAGYRVTVKNRGTGIAKDIAVSVDLPDEFANVRGMTPTKEEVKPEGNRLTFPITRELAPGASLSYYIEVEGSKAGTARVLAEVKADYLSQALREEQATRVIERK